MERTRELLDEACSGLALFGRQGVWSLCSHSLASCLCLGGHFPGKSKLRGLGTSRRSTNS